MLAVFVLASALAGRAEADCVLSTARDRAAAQNYLTEATKYYADGAYDKAIPCYQAAYQLFSNKHLLLFNIGQAQRKAGHLSDARTYYLQFLEKAPRNALVPETKSYLAAIEKQLAEEKEKKDARAAVDQAKAIAMAQEEAAQQRKQAAELLKKEEDARKPIYKRAWFWVVIGVGAAAVATGLGVGLKYGVPPAPPASELTPQGIRF